MAALIIVGDDMPQGRIVGLEWPEFLVRRASLCGAGHIVLLVDRVPRALVAAVDRMRADGLAVDLVRSAPDAADRFHPDEGVLVLTGRSVIAQEALEALVHSAPPALLTIADATSSDAYERIDAATQWPGALLLDGAAIRATAAMVGEWDMGSTLLRHAVQAGGARIAIEEGDGVLPVTSAGAATVASRVLVDHVEFRAEGWGEALVIGPLTRAGALYGFDHAAAINRIAPWVAVGGFAAALLFGLLHWPTLAALVLLIGCLAQRLADHVATATRLRSFLAQYLGIGRGVAAAGTLLLLVLPSQVDHAPLALAAMLIAVMVLAGRLPLPLELSRPRWLPDVPGLAILIGLGGLFGGLGLEIALVAAVGHALAGLGWLQNRLSMVLTTPR